VFFFLFFVYSPSFIPPPPPLPDNATWGLRSSRLDSIEPRTTLNDVCRPLAYVSGNVHDTPTNLINKAYQ
jgi:hypothetical protein